MQSMWEERFAAPGYFYGTEPNVFLKQHLPMAGNGRKALFVAEGEGRNAVYAARCGYEVTATDYSERARDKALALATRLGVEIDYLVADASALDLPVKSFDVLGLFYAHFDTPERSAIHRRLLSYLKPGSLVIFEAFAKDHPPYKKLYPKIGGPVSPSMLFSTEDVRAEFPGLDFSLLEHTETELYETDIEKSESERGGHIGRGRVVRFVGRVR